MILNSCELREKDVINVCDGSRLGFICDFSVDTECGRICAIFVTDRFFTLTGHKNTAQIGWERIVCIGEDAVLVNVGADFRLSCSGNKEEKRIKTAFDSVKP